MKLTNNFSVSTELAAKLYKGSKADFTKFMQKNAQELKGLPKAGQKAQINAAYERLKLWGTKQKTK